MKEQWFSRRQRLPEQRRAPHLLCQDPQVWPRFTWDTCLLPAAPYSTVWLWAGGKQQRASSPSSPLTEQGSYGRKGKRRKKEVPQKGGWEGQGSVAPLVMDDTGDGLTGSCLGRLREQVGLDLS